MTDYAVNGEPVWGGIYTQSNFAGHFPHELSTIFPWVNFFGGCQRNFLMKEEMIGGAHGIETRYPFLDPNVVQEFLWLHEDVKNSVYKKPVHDLLMEMKYPFKTGKTGFPHATSGVKREIDFERKISHPIEPYLPKTLFGLFLSFLVMHYWTRMNIL